MVDNWLFEGQEGGSPDFKHSPISVVYTIIILLDFKLPICSPGTEFGSDTVVHHCVFYHTVKIGVSDLKSIENSDKLVK